MAEPLTRERIVEEALAFAREEGVEAMTLRPLAARLGVSAPALYRHVASRGDLLALMVERLISDRPPAPRGLAWDDTLRATAHGMWEIYGAYPGLAQESLAGRTSSPLARSSALDLMDAVQAGGFPRADAERLTLAFLQWVLSFLAGGAHRVDPGERYAELPARPFDGTRALFDEGVELLLGGMRARLAPEGAESAPA